MPLRELGEDVAKIGERIDAIEDNVQNLSHFQD
jgi:hypothetical protein